jgi:prephenate dehydrogenase
MAAAILAGMHVGFLGFGLIAGSIARAVRQNPSTDGWTLAAWSPSGDGPARAAAEGVIDVAAVSPPATLAGADIVVLAAPATACLTLLDGLGGPWRSELPPPAVITDVASTKAALVARADAHGLRFVGGHPMAGIEAAGYDAAHADLFARRPWVLVPGAGATPSDIDRVGTLATACSAQVLLLDAGQHDRAVAEISHLPLVVAAALVEAVAGTPGAERPDWPLAARLAAGGWASATRVARGDPAMGAAIAATNAGPLAARIRDLQGVLDGWLAELEREGGPDESALAGRLAAARSMLERGG